MRKSQFKLSQSWWWKIIWSSKEAVMFVRNHSSTAEIHVKTEALWSLTSWLNVYCTQCVLERKYLSWLCFFIFILTDLCWYLMNYMLNSYSQTFGMLELKPNSYKTSLNTIIFVEKGFFFNAYSVQLVRKVKWYFLGQLRLTFLFQLK